ncbi:hypothetical protein SARC_04830 [Sphaeroforma arctica JP610]|uniref:F-box domain-containing protein n=1 Tax=Sphaeroforma arctica JP610 TaxID=667725 RepID=A0A0L0G165_9EUKA|nr:hypothetical protein SARC_04830 [Sphaeroforma arctica JP610]KNC82887.1 hypothetical protein SARC_04830 [Sphaeroforma arctica JP610]|eukprot:XP_014156789.1 hypothetical protein SARC_04830 [Sphaeroforma arctica JP610]
MDHFEILPAELIQNILRYLPGRDLLRVSCVSRNFRSVINYAELFRDLCQRTSRDDTGEWTIECRRRPPRLRLGKQHGKEFCSSPSAESDVNWKQIWTDLVNLQSKHRDYVYPLIDRGVYASTTDREDQILANTLHNGSSFWSSIGTTTTTPPECVAYKLVQPVCVVTAVEIFPFKAVSHHGLPTYGPQRVRISVGFSEHAWHYVSDIMVCGNISEAQVFNIAPDIVVGSHIKIELLGRRSIQPADGLYYIVLKQVKAYGIPLGVLDMPVLAELLLKEATSFGCNVLQDKAPEIALQQLESGFSDSLEARTEGKAMLVRFAAIFKRGDYINAAQYTGRSSAGPLLRDMVEYFEILEAEAGDPTHLQYYRSLSETGIRLNENESLALVRESNRTRDYRLLSQYTSQDDVRVTQNISCTERMGDLIVESARSERDGPVRKEMYLAAMRVYYHATTWDKMIDMLLELCYFGVIMNFPNGIQYQFNWPSMLAQVVERHNSRALGLQFAGIIVQHRRVGDEVHRTLGMQLSVKRRPHESWGKAIVRECVETRSAANDVIESLFKN